MYANRKEYGYNERRYQAIMRRRRWENKRFLFTRYALIASVTPASMLIAGFVAYVYGRWGIAI